MTALPLPPLPPPPLHDAHAAATESFLLALLSDSNLPTGGFVASSGLEAWIQHGYLSLPAPALPSSSGTTGAPPASSSSSADHSAPLLAFVKHSLHSYARVNAPLLCAAHAAVWSLSHPPPSTSSASSAPPTTSTNPSIDAALSAVLAADQLCESLTLNHVARRASVTQGAAFLSLYERAFAPPAAPLAPSAAGAEGEGDAGERVRELVRRLRDRVRRTAAGREEVGESGRERAYGHMTVSYAVLTAAVGLRIDAALPLLLFLHARSLLSSAVRLNTVGPYLAHRMLLWDVRPLVDGAVAAVAVPACSAQSAGGAEEGEVEGKEGEEREKREREEDWWDDDPFWRPIWGDDPLSPSPPLLPSSLSLSSNAPETPAPAPAPALKKTRPEDAPSLDSIAWPVTTWPLGEIVATRHDQLFTKVFNS